MSNYNWLTGNIEDLSAFGGSGVSAQQSDGGLLGNVAGFARSVTDGLTPLMGEYLRFQNLKEQFKLTQAGQIQNAQLDQPQVDQQPGATPFDPRQGNGNGNGNGNGFQVPPWAPLALVAVAVVVLLRG